MNEIEEDLIDLSLVWFPIFIILLIKSNFVLASLYSVSNLSLLRSTMATSFPLIFLISFSFLLTNKRKLLYLFLLDFLLSLLFIIDIVYGRAYGHLISIYMMFAKNVMNDLSASVISLIRYSDFLILTDLPFFFFLITTSKNNKTNITSKKRKILFVITCFVSIFAICLQFIKLEDNKILGNYRLQPLYMSPIGNHMFDLYRFFYEKRYNLTYKDILTIEDWFLENMKYQEPDKTFSNLKGLIKDKNIITIQVESLENFTIGATYFGQEITPNINRLLKNSIYFNNIHEQVKDGNSSDAELLAITSIYPLGNGSAFLRFGENEYVTLPKLLKEEGYTSIAIHGDDKEFWNRNNVFSSLGFDKYITEEQFRDQSFCGMGITDGSLFSQSISEIKKIKEPFNLFIITLTSHMPFKLNNKLKYLDLVNDNVESNYLQSIHYTDKVLGDFYNQLKTEGLLANTVIIIYGDHEGIHKYYKTTLSDNNYKIPFIVHIPGMEGFVSNKIGGEIDIMPTVAYLLGIDTKKYSLGVMGQNLFNNSQDMVILPSGQILGESGDKEHLRKAQGIADLIIKGNYFALNQGQFKKLFSISE